VKKLNRILVIDDEPTVTDGLRLFLGESGFRVDPPIPNLAKITWGEIERRREKAGVPSIVLDAALAMKSKTMFGTCKSCHDQFRKPEDKKKK